MCVCVCVLFPLLFFGGKLLLLVCREMYCTYIFQVQVEARMPDKSSEVLERQTVAALVKGTEQKHMCIYIFISRGRQKSRQNGWEQVNHVFSNLFEDEESCVVWVGNSS